MAVFKRLKVIFLKQVESYNFSMCIITCNVYHYVEKWRYEEPKLKNPCTDLNNAYLSSRGTYWKIEHDLYSLVLCYDNHQEDLKLITNCNVRHISLHDQCEMHHCDFWAGYSLTTTLRCLKVAFLKSIRRDDSSDIYFYLSSFCGSPATENSILKNKNSQR